MGFKVVQEVELYEMSAWLRNMAFFLDERGVIDLEL
jgi:hypothetical protein